ncbi:hypothetical protein ACFE04_031311 [Oxalis oulophora]
MYRFRFPSLRLAPELVHVLLGEMLGKSTFELVVLLTKWFHVWFVDKLFLIMACLLLGNTKKYSLNRPSTGPLELKSTKGKTPRQGTRAMCLVGFKKNKFPRGYGWKGNAGIYAVGLQGEDYPVHRLTLLKSQKILGKFGNKKLSNKRKGPQFVIEDAFHFFYLFICWYVNNFL